MKTVSFSIRPTLFAVAAALASMAHAGEPIQIGDAQLDWSLTTSYNVAVRVAKPDPVLTGQTWMWNAKFNDGNNNFDRWSLVNNRFSALLQTKLTRGDSGIVINATGFYDDVYHNKNDNRADKFVPFDNRGRAVNRPNRLSTPYTASSINDFTPEAKRYHGGYTRFLDVYGYTNFEMGGGRTNLKFGRHVVSWGESLFFPNISMAQGPLDGSKANVPGTEIKEIMLPEDQISMSWQMNPETTLLANYQFGFHKTVPDAPGSYLARSDVVGPGGTCLVDYDPNSYRPDRPGAGCRFIPFGIVPQTGSAAAASAGPGAYRDEILPPKSGQWGIGLRRRISNETELGFYYLQYHERIPLPYITYADTNITSRAPSYWQNLYQKNIKLLGASFTTSLGDFVVGGEIAHRRGAPVIVGGSVDNTLPPAERVKGKPVAFFGGTYFEIFNPSTANLTQLNLNTFANFGRTVLAPRTLWLAEMAYVNVGGVKPAVFPTLNAPTVNSPAIIGDELRLYSKNNLGFMSRFQLDYPGVFDGWDLSVPISYSQQLLGRNMLSNLGGKGDKTMAIATEFTRGNLQLRADYVNYLGKPSTDDLGSRVLTDRDFVSVGVKYTF